MEQSKKDAIINVLKKLDFVKWDRYFGKGDNLTFYGWIDREDNYKDFVFIEFNEGEYITHGTSSSKYSKKIAEILGKEHSDCIRIEDFCNIPNMIKLEENSVKKVG
ncbi:MAG: hypothetical protein ABIH28_02935 [archaeon]